METLMKANLQWCVSDSGSLNDTCKGYFHNAIKMSTEFYNG